MGELLTKKKPGTIDLAKLDIEIAQAMGWKRHKRGSDKNCYCGLTMDTVDIDNEKFTRIIIEYTKDGRNAKHREDLTSTEYGNILRTIEKHNG